ncbi:MAG: hypothetical protein AB7O62_06275 [Pirellulales bacterium]
MIIPTAEFDPLFARDGVPFRTKMVEYIQQEFADILGPRMHQLEREIEEHPMGACLQSSRVLHPRRVA